MSSKAVKSNVSVPKIENDHDASSADHVHPGAEHDHSHDHDHSGDHDHSHDTVAGNSSVVGWKQHWDLLLAFFILVVLLVLRFAFNIKLPATVSLVVNTVAYILAGRSVLGLAFRKLRRGDVFNEFVLMSVATIGAFVIGEYEEGVAVMVFYQIGEWFQDSAVDRAKRSIKSLLDIRPDKATVIRSGVPVVVAPAEILPEEIIEVKPGEKIALDGELISEQGSFNTAALTGESKPDTIQKGKLVYAGMINLNTVVQVRVSTLFKDSKLSNILSLVQDATARKSQTQLFISKFARVYTPIVFFLALAVCLVPYFLVDNYQFGAWFYRALVFLVISCPCALVVSIPLGYFGGIGLASRNGLLFKGGNFLDVMARIDTVVMDKTGTLTKGVFKVQKVESVSLPEPEFIRLAASLEAFSTHPVAQAVVTFATASEQPATLDHPTALEQPTAVNPDREQESNAANRLVDSVEEVPGYGIKGNIIASGEQIIAGNLKLLEKSGVAYPAALNQIVESLVVVAIKGTYAGYLMIADELKEDASQAISEMGKLGLRTVMLSGDKQSMVDQVASTLGLTEAYGDLLPADKVAKVEELKNQGRRIAFVGDGVNDAPVIALADAGIAMGGLGSDATIETADIVIQNDQPSKIIAAIRIGKITRSIVWQNIILAMTVKVIVLTLGAGGVATLWEAVIADVGVALLAILNAARVQHLKL